jgi:hypothetical protein
MTCPRSSSPSKTTRWVVSTYSVIQIQNARSYWCNWCHRYCTFVLACKK